MNNCHKFDRLLKIVNQVLKHLCLFSHPCEFFFDLTQGKVNICVHSVQFESLLQHLRAIDLLLIYATVSKDKANWFCNYLVLIVKFDRFQSLWGSNLNSWISSNRKIKARWYWNQKINSICCLNEALVYVFHQISVCFYPCRRSAAV